MLRQIKWEVQNGPITNFDLLVTNFLSLKFCVRLRTSYKELI